MKSKDFDMQIIIVSGPRDTEKAISGLATALSCASSGFKIVVFFMMQGAAFGNPNEGLVASIHGFKSIQEYIDLLLESGVTVEACTSCVENYCVAKKVKGVKELRPGIGYAGLSTAAIRAITTKTIVF